jgi:branched-chain amino acid transport system permease protein
MRLPKNSIVAIARPAWPVSALALLILAVAIAGSALGGEVLQRVVIAGLINLVLVIGLYVFVGNSGVFSFGQMSFMAIGAYTAGLLTLPNSSDGSISTQLPGFLHGMHLPSLPATIVAGAVAAVIGLVISIPLMRMAGLAASVAMFGVLVIVHVVASNWNDVTGGTAGMAGVPTSTTRNDALMWVLIALVIAYVFQLSRFGLRLRASREDEIAARALGIGVFNERRLAFALSAFVIGIGGALYGQFVGSFNPNAFYLEITFLTIVMAVVGGVNSLAGAVVGSMGISAIAELLRRLEGGVQLGSVHITGRLGLQQVGLAGIMLLALLLRPSGITGGREISWPFQRPFRAASEPFMPVGKGVPGQADGPMHE